MKLWFYLVAYISPISHHQNAIKNSYLQNTWPYRSLKPDSKSHCLPDNLIYCSFKQKEATLERKVEKIQDQKGEVLKI